MKKNIALVMGGYSGEHDISIASGHQVFDQLDHQKYNVYKIIVERDGWYWEDGTERRPVDRSDFTIADPTAQGGKLHFDLAFIIIHGNPGENGVLQGYFDMLGIPYTTCGFYTSALTFHKGYCNAFVRAVCPDVCVARNAVITKGQCQSNTLPTLPDFRYPVFVKPATGGSSVATTKVKTPDALPAAVYEAFTEADEVMIEEGIAGREFDCGVMRTAQGEMLVFPITEIIPTGGHEFFDYEAKYQGFSNEVTPAEVQSEVAAEVQRVSADLYNKLDCRGVVRFDFIYDTQAKQLYFLEVNTIPGQSAESIVPKQARAMGITPAELYQMCIDAALR